MTSGSNTADMLSKSMSSGLTVLPQLAESQKQVVALKWELQEVKRLHESERDMSVRYQQRIQELEEETTDLKEENDTLQDRHEAHTEELRFLQTELFCVKSHLEKLKKELGNFQTLVQQGAEANSSFWKSAPNYEELEDTSQRICDRQDFTIMVLDTTVKSLEEILEEYVPPVMAPVVDEEGEILPQEEEEKEEVPPPQSLPSAMKQPGGGKGSSTKRRVSITELEMPESRPSLSKGASSKKKKGLLKKLSSRKLFKGSSRKLKTTPSAEEELEHQQKQKQQNEFVTEMFKANQIRFAQYLQGNEGSQSKRNFSNYQNSRTSWALDKHAKEAVASVKELEQHQQVSWDSD